MPDPIAELTARTGYVFRRPELGREALTHPSVTTERGVAEIERLEFLGDAVLSLVVSEQLLRQLPGASEGELTKLRARLVNTGALARKAREVSLAELIVLGKGEEKSGGRRKPSILAGVLEAVLGAVFLDGGFDAARAVVERLFGDDVRGVQLARSEEDAKTALQELTQSIFKQLPVYETLRVAGPDHARDFLVAVSVGGEVLGSGSGRSKRVAAQNAAREALARLRVQASEG